MCEIQKTLTRLIILFILGSFAVLLPESGFASQRIDDGYISIPPEQLYLQGMKYMAKEPMEADSAMMCYLAIITNQPKLGEEDIEVLIKAYINAAFIYNIEANDLKQAYLYLKKALALAEKHNCNGLKPYIYMNIADALQGYDEMLAGPDQITPNNRDIVKNNISAFEYAVEAEEFELALAALYNIILSSEPKDLKELTRLYGNIRNPLSTRGSGSTMVYIDSLIGVAHAMANKDYINMAEKLEQLMELPLPENIQVRMRPVFLWQTHYMYGIAKLEAGATDNGFRILTDILEDLYARNDIRGQLAVLSSLSKYSDVYGNKDFLLQECCCYQAVCQ
ncbi:MAG: hypothetical protein K2F87_01435 [Muribaculaceae bacterium]|nr:hypothetical protein [Muribaculaceae bacterium]